VCGIICSPLTKQNTDDLRRIFLRWALPLTRMKMPKKSGCGWLCLCILTWVEVRPRPRGAAHGTICSSISWGSCWLQRLHGKAICEKVWIELCAGPQLRKGENRREMEKKNWSLDHLPEMASCPKVQRNSTHKYLSSNQCWGVTSLASSQS
jgi:hypothetical protein